MNENLLEIHMGDDFKKLSPLLQKAHLGTNVLKGVVTVTRGNWLAHIICNIFKFPKEGENTPMQVDCSHSPDDMIWNRDFDGLKMTSHFKRKGDFLVEKLGPLDLSFTAIEKNGALHYLFENTKLWGIPMPKFLSPQVQAFEKEAEGQYEFSVVVTMFLIGKILAYGGNLVVT